jgi:putative transposase
MRRMPQWRWHLDEVLVRINGEIHFLWRAVDHEREVLEAFVTKRRDRGAALKFPRRAMKEVGDEARQATGRWLNDRAENSHRPFRRRERAMAKFRSAKSLRTFASIHSSIHNHFNQERHLYSRQAFKVNRSAALAEWRQLAA